MGLGQSFDAFRPKTNETAASLLTPTKTEHKKEVFIQIRIEEDKTRGNVRSLTAFYQ